MRKNKLKFIFFGTAEFSAIILEKLINTGFILEAVVCNPDKPIGRKKIITPPPVKISIMKQVESIKDKIKIFQPEKLIVQDIYNCRDRDNCIYRDCDLFIVAAYAKIIPKEILEIPRLGTIGVHPSLLPKYRGSSPIQTAILNGEKETGTTLYLIDEKLDHGPIFAQRKLKIHNTNYLLLSTKLAELSADLLIEFLRKLNQCLGSPTSKTLMSQFREVGLPEIGIKLQPQDESQATYTKKFKTEDGYIEPKDLEKAQGSTDSPQETRRLAIEIERKIRALNPEPGVWTYAKALTNRRMRINENKRVKILETELTPEGKLKLKKIQVEGKKPQRV